MSCRIKYQLIRDQKKQMKNTKCGEGKGCATPFLGFDVVVKDSKERPEMPQVKGPRKAIYFRVFFSTLTCGVFVFSAVSAPPSSFPPSSRPSSRLLHTHTHTCSEISYRITDVECIKRAKTPRLSLTGEVWKTLRGVHVEVNFLRPCSEEGSDAAHSTVIDQN